MYTPVYCNAQFIKYHSYTCTVLIFLSEDLHFLWLVQHLFPIYNYISDYSTGNAFPMQTHSWKLFDACQTAVWGASFAQALMIISWDI